MSEPDMSVWTGRVDAADGPSALRWHQMVQPLTPGCQPGIVLVGFACDEGVRRNGGRVGAKDGPRAIRQALANLAWHQERYGVYDAGDVACDDGDMEGAQSRLAQVVASVIRAGHRPLILGGGHETAWGTFQGVVDARAGEEIGVINLDAHLDMRNDEPGNSGTPFRQIARWCSEKYLAFRYLCLGVSIPSNTSALFDQVSSRGATYVPDTEIVPWAIDETVGFVDQLARRVDQLYLSVDLDVLPAAVMPAVSAPAARGVALEAAEALIRAAFMTGKVVAIDLVELNPSLDTDGRGTRVAARLAWLITQYSEWHLEASHDPHPQ
jgi:formiminoglutamase